MLVQFNELSANAKVWIYQLDRALDSQERTVVERLVADFCKQWQAHGVPLKTSFLLSYDHFLILAVDENVASASGCSIDGSVRILKDIATTLNVDFFNRTLAAFIIDEEIKVYPMIKLKELFEAGTLTSSTITFNNLVASKSEFEISWKVPVGQSWLARYLPKSTVA